MTTCGSTVKAESLGFGFPSSRSPRQPYVPLSRRSIVAAILSPAVLHPQPLKLRRSNCVSAMPSRGRDLRIDDVGASPVRAPATMAKTRVVRREQRDVSDAAERISGDNGDRLSWPRRRGRLGVLATVSVLRQ
jgi:hypothetical protein